MNATDLYVTAKHNPEGLLALADDIRALAVRWEALESAFSLSSMQGVTRIDFDTVELTFRVNQDLLEGVLYELVAER